MYRYPNALRILVGCLLAGAAAWGSTPAAMPSFPFNGSFEIVSGGKPVGWEVNGPWFVRVDSHVTGRNGITVLETMSKAEATLTSGGYLRVQPGETLGLSFTYLSPTGGISCGLVYCDRLGNPLGSGAWEALPVACDWTPYQRCLSVPDKVVIPMAPVATEPTPTPQPDVTAPAADGVPLEADGPGVIPAPAPLEKLVPCEAVRLVFRMERDAVALKLDDVALTGAETAGPMPRAPMVRAEQRPNLAPNPYLNLDAEGKPLYWSAVQAPEAALATVEPGATPDTGQLALQGGEAAAAWVSDAVLLDGALPYRIEADVRATGLADGDLRLLVELVDPRDPAAVWLQQLVTVPSSQETPVVMTLPRLWSDKQAVQARVGLMVQGGAKGSALLRSVALRPEPLSVSVRSAAIAGGFRKPADVSLFISAVNNTYTVLKPKAVLQVSDACGETVTSETRPIVIGSRSAAYFPYKPKLAATGTYTLTVTIVNAGKELGTTSYSFRVGDVATTALAP